MIILAQSAIEDLKNIEIHLPEPSLKKIMDKIFSSMEAIEIHPLLGKKGRVGNTRELYISSTNYILIYKIEDTNIEILNILHTSRNY
ncbi:Type II toxin-antitoxin system RelE/ParE family toxin [Candidatus Hepatincolaceae symbiont of Richtersius coronifer]